MVKESEHSLGALLIRDNVVARSGVRRLLERDGIAIVGETADPDAAHSLFGRLKPDVVVMQIATPGSNAVEVMRGLLAQRRDARVVFFCMHEHPVFAARALRAGVYGYVTEASAPPVLLEAIRAVVAGRKFVGPHIAQKIALHDHAVSLREELTSRELEVLRLLSLGLSVKEIAASMGLSVKTIANQQSALKDKLQADTSVEVLRRASAMGLVQLF